MRLHWTECGVVSDKPPLVLLHGINDSHLTWKRIAPLLAADRRVLMPDAPGCGLSERPNASYELGWHAHMIATWLKGMGLQQVDIAGHSFGGGVAQVLLLEPSIEVRRLCLIASGGLGRRVGVWLRLATVPGVVEHFGQPFMASGTRLALRGAHGSISEQDIAELSAMNAASGTARAFARTIQDVITWRGQSRQFFQRAHEIARLPAIRLWSGERDMVIPHTEAIAFAQAMEGVALHEFPGCGHYLHHEQPEQLVREVRAFLDAPHVPPARLRPAPPTIPSTWPWERGWSALATLIPARKSNQPGGSPPLASDPCPSLGRAEDMVAAESLLASSAAS
jgi:pimeloyl-ACP methyl ester carboxylesterase